MIVKKSILYSIVCCCVFILSLALANDRPQSPSEAKASQEHSKKPGSHHFVVSGKPLDYWVSSVSNDLGPEDLKATVEALSLALSADDIAVRVTAADALAVLGPRAKTAMPALVSQLSHQQGWVRVAAMGAMAAIGKDAVGCKYSSVTKSLFFQKLMLEMSAVV